MRSHSTPVASPIPIAQKIPEYHQTPRCTPPDSTAAFSPKSIDPRALPQSNAQTPQRSPLMSCRWKQIHPSHHHFVRYPSVPTPSPPPFASAISPSTPVTTLHESMSSSPIRLLPSHTQTASAESPPSNPSNYFASHFQSAAMGWSLGGRQFQPEHHSKPTPHWAKHSNTLAM